MGFYFRDILKIFDIVNHIDSSDTGDQISTKHCHYSSIITYETYFFNVLISSSAL